MDNKYITKEDTQRLYNEMQDRIVLARYKGLPDVRLPELDMTTIFKDNQRMKVQDIVNIINESVINGLQ